MSEKSARKAVLISRRPKNHGSGATPPNPLGNRLMHQNSTDAETLRSTKPMLPTPVPSDARDVSE